jgi:hypothetical protein
MLTDAASDSRFDFPFRDHDNRLIFPRRRARAIDHAHVR